MNDLSVANNTKFLGKERKTGCTRILSGRGFIFTGCEPKPAPTNLQSQHYIVSGIFLHVTKINIPLSRESSLLKTRPLIN